MKKVLTLAFALMLGVAQAASFDWGTGSVKASFNGTAFTTTDYSVTAYLVALTSTDTSEMFTVSYEGTGSITPASSVDSKTPTVTGGNANKGKIKGTYTSTDIANGNNYGMYILFTDSEGTKWYNFSSTVYTVSGLADETSSLDAATFAFDFDSKTEITKSSQTVSAGGGWHSIAVPEPSTAMLALAGLALLIKRRHA